MKTAFVTGGSRGIGSAIALALGKTFHVIVGFANSEDKANDVVKEIVAAGGVQVQFRLIYLMLNL